MYSANRGRVERELVELKEQELVAEEGDICPKSWTQGR